MVAELPSTLTRRLEAGFRWYLVARVLEGAAVAAGAALLVVASELANGVRTSSASITWVASIVGALAFAATWIERRPTRREFSAAIDRREGFRGELETAATLEDARAGSGLGRVLRERVEQRFAVGMARRAAFATTLAFVAFALLCAVAWIAAAERRAAGTGSELPRADLDARTLVAAAGRLDTLAAAARAQAGADTSETRGLAAHARALGELALAVDASASSSDVLRALAQAEALALRGDLAHADDADVARALRQALSALAAAQGDAGPKTTRDHELDRTGELSGPAPGLEPGGAGSARSRSDSGRSADAPSGAAGRDASSSVSSGAADGTMSGSVSSSASEVAGAAAPGSSSPGTEPQDLRPEGGILTSRWWAREHDEVVERWVEARRRARDRRD